MKTWTMLHKSNKAYRVMSKRYVLEVQEDEYGDVFVTLPDELLEEAGWDVGDVLEYEEDIDGSVILHKIIEE